MVRLETLELADKTLVGWALPTINPVKSGICVVGSAHPTSFVWSGWKPNLRSRRGRLEVGVLVLLPAHRPGERSFVHKIGQLRPQRKGGGDVAIVGVVVLPLGDLDAERFVIACRRLF